MLLLLYSQIIRDWCRSSSRKNSVCFKRKLNMVSERTDWKKFYFASLTLCPLQSCFIYTFVKKKNIYFISNSVFDPKISLWAGYKCDLESKNLQPQEKKKKKDWHFLRVKKYTTLSNKFIKFLQKKMNHCLHHKFESVSINYFFLFIFFFTISFIDKDFCLNQMLYFWF